MIQIWKSCSAPKLGSEARPSRRRAALPSMHVLSTAQYRPRRPAQHASAQRGARPLQVAEFVNSQPSGPAALSSLLAGLCRYSERSPSDNQRIEIAMRCVKALIRTDKGLAGVITSPALVCQAFASGGGS